MQNKILVSLATIFFSWSVFAESTDAPEPSFKYAHNYTTYTINPDGSFTTDVDYAITILKEDAIEDKKDASITHSTSVEKVDVIDAFTQKADGKRVDVPKSNYQIEVNSGKDKAAPAFSDYTTLTVIFPDVAVGDTVSWHYKITQTEPLFPKQFSKITEFNKANVYDDVRIKIDMPDSMSPQYEISQLTEKKTEPVQGHKIFEWTFQNKKPVKEDNSDYTYAYKFGKHPGYIISTFPSYAAISEAYGVRAKQRAEVTERIQKLADEITKDKKSPAEQAEALYDWVSSKITYAGNCIGVGSVVPRDTNFVLDNNMGDCKDHATLLEALLTAKKIPSTQALINTGKMYDLTKVPVVSQVNHVINFIPSLNVYLDSTAEDMPFGVLPNAEMGKPVLLVDGYKEGLKTPTVLHDSEKNVTKVKIKIGADGSAKGSVEWTGYGRSGLFTNAKPVVKKWVEFYNDKEKSDTYYKNVLKKLGFENGTMKIHLDEHPKSPDIAKSVTSFDVKEFIHAGTSGAFHIDPIFSSSIIYSSINSAKKSDEPNDDFTCYGGHYEEEYVYEFPKNIKILAAPDNLSFSNKIQSYQAIYKLKNNTLTVKRKLDDMTVGPVCEPKIGKAYKELAEKAMPNLDSQVVYK